HFLKLEGGPRPVRLGLAVAGPVYGDEVKLTNVQWRFSIRRLKKDMNLERIAVVNDLEALALVLPHLNYKDAVLIGEEAGNGSIRAPMAVLCPGTGLGIAGLAPVEQGWRPIATEGGHTSLSPLTDKEMAVWQFLRERHGRVSVERVLSGPGIVELYTALAFLEGRPLEAVSPEDIVRLALDGESPLAVETIEMFCAWLGDVAGDVALMYVARGGVWLAGDILLTIFEILKRSQFRRRFEHKGRGTGIVTATPTFLVSCESPVLRGCTYLLDSF
ncbi:MAG: glucokinase, partial [Deltaproteobacteria bacterium]|nr:glucokinase [Deltaproteobacteria bacterium]